ncbi:MAG: hypothetical protein J6Y54_00955, partial [Lentisphaeria bacterium]|nr:hypothetical protein [Lentisphaeria bacterium]
MIVVFMILYSMPFRFYRRYGLLSFSSPMVVLPPWPGNTRVSGGSGRSSRRIDSISVSQSPPGRSVLPVVDADVGERPGGGALRQLRRRKDQFEVVALNARVGDDRRFH